MKISKLRGILKAGEWNDAEFKEARSDVPKSAYETVSAFANTRGGHLIFGISQNADEFEIAGVEKPDKIQNDFLSALHADAKTNHDIRVEEHRRNIGGKKILIFRIAENPRTRKPVYLDGDIRRTFLRKGGGDYKAQTQDIERMLRDATADRWDGQPFEKVPAGEALSSASLRWYRSRFHQANPGFDPNQTDNDFLYHWGFLLKEKRRFIPTRAAIMLFGSPLAVHHLLPRPVLDLQFLGYRTGDPIPETRWLDRLVCEDNILQAWEQLVAKFMFFMPKPFRSIDPVTLERRDAPPGYRVFREAAINLLIHQDYGDHSRKAVIRFFRDGIQFWNPGDVFGDDSRLWEPGEKEVRNPSIAMALRRIEMCEQAGTGLRMMRETWKRLGHPAPSCRNDRAGKSFEFFIPGLDKEVDAASDLAKTVSGGKAPDKAPVEVPVKAPVVLFATDRVILSSLSSGECGRNDLLKSLGHVQRSGGFRKSIARLLEGELIERTIPEKPCSRLQKYRITAQGRQLLEERKA